MLVISQILLLLASCPSVMADVSANDEGVPKHLAQDSLDISILYSQSRFIPLSFNAAIHQNGSSKRGQGPCYGMSFYGLLFYVSISLSLTLLKFKILVILAMEQHAVIMAAVLAMARSVVETVSVMRVMDVVKI
jgi:hypothetical protein